MGKRGRGSDRKEREGESRRDGSRQGEREWRNRHLQRSHPYFLSFVRSTFVSQYFDFQLQRPTTEEIEAELRMESNSQLQMMEEEEEKQQERERGEREREERERETERWDGQSIPLLSSTSLSVSSLVASMHLTDPLEVERERERERELFFQSHDSFHFSPDRS